MQSSQQTGRVPARGRALIRRAAQVIVLLGVPVLAAGYLAGGVFTARVLGDSALAVSPFTFDAPSETVQKDRAMASWGAGEGDNVTVLDDWEPTQFAFRRPIRPRYGRGNQPQGNNRFFHRTRPNASPFR